MGQDYGKGVVLYLENEKVVGALLWNVFHQVPVARKAIEEQWVVDDIVKMAALFHLYDEE